MFDNFKDMWSKVSHKKVFNELKDKYTNKFRYILCYHNSYYIIGISFYLSLFHRKDLVFSDFLDQIRK